MLKINTLFYISIKNYRDKDNLTTIQNQETKEYYSAIEESKQIIKVFLPIFLYCDNLIFGFSIH